MTIELTNPPTITDAVDLRLEPMEGLPAIFTDSDGVTTEVTKVTKVWGTGKGGCVNLANGKTSVPSFVAGDEGLPSGYYCVLFLDEPHERDPEVPDLRIPFGELAVFQRIEVARALPEVHDEGDGAVMQLTPDADCIHHFKDSDGRNMRIVATPIGFAKEQVPTRA